MRTSTQITEIISMIWTFQWYSEREDRLGLIHYNKSRLSSVLLKLPLLPHHIIIMYYS